MSMRWTGKTQNNQNKLKFFNILEKSEIDGDKMFKWFFKTGASFVRQNC